MATELIVNASLPETRIALMENGEIQELLIERASGKGIVGNIYKGRVTRVLPGMQAAFVDIGLEKAAFLYVDDVYMHSHNLEAEASDETLGDLQDTEDGQNSEVPRNQVGAGASGENLQSELSDNDFVNNSERTSRNVENLNKTSVKALLREGVDPIPLGPTLSTSKSDLNPFSESQIDNVDYGPGLPENWRSRDRAEESSPEETSLSSTGEEIPDGSDDEDDDDNQNKNSGPVSMSTKKNDSEIIKPGKDNLERSENQTDVVPKDTIPEGLVVAKTREISVPEVPKVSQRHAKSVAAGGGSTRKNWKNRREEHYKKKNRVETTHSSSRTLRHQNVLTDDQTENPQAQLDPDAIKVNLEKPSNAEVQVQPEVESPRTEGIHSESQVSPKNLPRSGAASPAVVLETTENPNPPLPRVSAHRGSEIKKNIENRPRRTEYKPQPRTRDRRIRSKSSLRITKPPVNIQDLIKEGQEVIVQIAKDPIATKGARLTCHISLPGRHLVCMPTIDHVGVSRRIEREDERRRLREAVERNRPKKLGFIVRTASGKHQSADKRIIQDIDYLARLWTEIKDKAIASTAPAIVYEDLNAILRAIRDWVTEDIDKIIVDSRYHFHEIQKFVSHFMPSLKSKVELYHGDIPVFDAYGISTELSRALERKVWLKSGGYIVIDQAEALVAIDVNTGRYVGKKNLEDTILKTNLEAVQEIAYQLRLRNCGGIIILDLIDMEKEENRQRVYRALEDHLKKDRARPTIMKISDLGLVEMTRKRTRDTIIRTLCEPCTHCEGKGFIKSKQTVAYEVMREVEREGIEKDTYKVLVQANPDVIDILAIDERETLDQLERRYRKQILLQAVMDFHPEQFEVTGDKKTRNSHRSQSSGSGRERNYSYRMQEKSDTNQSHVQAKRERNIDSQVTKHPLNQRPVLENRVIGETNNSEPAIPNIKQAPDKVIVVEIASEVSTLPSPLTDSGITNNHQENVQENVQPNRTLSLSRADDFEEEDRLAFLRAQAAQDAAIAQQRATHQNSSSQRNSNNAGHRNSMHRNPGSPIRSGPGTAKGSHSMSNRDGGDRHHGRKNRKNHRNSGKFKRSSNNHNSYGFKGSRNDYSTEVLPVKSPVGVAPSESVLSQRGEIALGDTHRAETAVNLTAQNADPTRQRKAVLDDFGNVKSTENSKAESSSGDSSPPPAGSVSQN